MADNDVHTYPVADLIEHDTDGGDCPCGPTIEAVFDADGSNGWHVTHHSLDGRETHVVRVHNHPPYRPACKERRVGDHLRGACLNDDGSDR